MSGEGFGFGRECRSAISGPSCAERRGVTIALEHAPDMIFAVEHIDVRYSETAEATIARKRRHKVGAAPSDRRNRHPLRLRPN